MKDAKEKTGKIKGDQDKSLTDFQMVAAVSPEKEKKLQEEC